MSDVDRVAQAGSPWVFTDGLAELLRGLTQAFDNLGGLLHLDWEAIHATWWSTPPEARRKKQAEFLVHLFFPWPLVAGIVVLDLGIRAHVRGLLAGPASPPPVSVNRSWYH